MESLNLKQLLKISTDSIISSMPKTDEELTLLVKKQIELIVKHAKITNQFEAFLTQSKPFILAETDMDPSISDSFNYWLEGKLINNFYKRI